MVIGNDINFFKCVCHNSYNERYLTKRIQYVTNSTKKKAKGKWRPGGGGVGVGGRNRTFVPM